MTTSGRLRGNAYKRIQGVSPRLREASVGLRAGFGKTSGMLRGRIMGSLPEALGRRRWGFAYVSGCIRGCFGEALDEYVRLLGCFGDTAGRLRKGIW